MPWWCPLAAVVAGSTNANGGLQQGGCDVNMIKLKVISLLNLLRTSLSAVSYIVTWSAAKP